MLKDVGNFFLFVFFIGLVLGAGLIAIYTYFYSGVIKSEKPIKPKIELIINENQVDTLYIYEK